MRAMYQMPFGQRFGRLTIVSEAPRSNGANRRFLLRCDCGRETISQGTALRSGRTRSCGCLRAETLSARRRIHGETLTSAQRTPEYRAWLNMKQRCSPRHAAHHLYADRGITICRRWIDSYEAFLADVGRRPSALHSLDRKENDRGYEPGNVRWATKAEQALNRRSGAAKAWAGRRENYGPSGTRPRAEKG